MSYTNGVGIIIGSMWISGALVLNDNPLPALVVWGFATVLTVLYVVDDFSTKCENQGET